MLSSSLTIPTVISVQTPSSPSIHICVSNVDEPSIVCLLGIYLMTNIKGVVAGSQQLTSNKVNLHLL